jgi:hypothetical protein
MGKRKDRHQRAKEAEIRASVVRGRQGIEPFVLELYAALGAGLARYGLSQNVQKALFEESLKRSFPDSPSATHLNEIRPLGDLLSVWRESKPYVDEDGSPKILPIRGRGATFESLARRYFPKKGLEEVLELADRFAKVGRLPGNRIAIYGDTLVNLSQTSASALAQTVLHVKQIIDTCLFNIGRAEEIRGRAERIVSHLLNPRGFEAFNEGMVREIQDLCERVDRLLKTSARRSSGHSRDRRTAGIGVYVYYDGEMQHQARRPEGR